MVTISAIAPWTRLPAPSEWSAKRLQRQLNVTELRIAESCAADTGDLQLTTYQDPDATSGATSVHKSTEPYGNESQGLMSHLWTNDDL